MASPDVSRPSVLLVEDDAPLADLLQRYIRQHSDFTVAWVDRGDEAIDAILSGGHALVVLDLGLPGMDGYEVCARVRSSYPGCIMILTGQTEDHAQLSCLELGADDYVVKPCNLEILLARMKALLRRTDRAAQRLVRAGKGALVVADEPIRVGDLVVDPSCEAVTVGQQTIQLSQAERDLLLVLAMQAGRPVPRAELYRHLGHDDWDGRGRAVDMLITRLRRKLGDDPSSPKRILTVRGEGYLLAV